MERAKNLIAVSFQGNWSDLGGWDSIWKIQKSDQNNIVASENVTTIDCKDVLLRSESVGQHLVGIGLSNLIIVAMQDAVLVANKDYSENVKDAVNELKKKKVNQAEDFPKDYRPWGWFERLVVNGRFQVKRIFVKPGASLVFKVTIIDQNTGLLFKVLQKLKLIKLKSLFQKVKVFTYH